jgi:hypothetical protein
VLATDPVGQIGDRRAPGKLLQNAAQKQPASEVDGRRQVLRAQIDQPADQVGIAAQWMQRAHRGMRLPKIDEKAVGDGTIRTGGGRRQGGGQGLDDSLELLHPRMFQRSGAAEFHEASPGTGRMGCAPAWACCG